MGDTQGSDEEEGLELGLGEELVEAQVMALGDELELGGREGLAMVLGGNPRLGGGREQGDVLACRMEEEVEEVVEEEGGRAGELQGPLARGPGWEEVLGEDVELSGGCGSR